MIRIVVDTNVLVSGVVFGGVPGQVLDLAKARSVLLFTSDAILAEFADVLQRPKIRWSQPEIVRAVAALSRFIGIIVPIESIRAVQEDPDDDRVLECAVAAEADLIVSGDRHLRKLGVFRGIPILNPRAFLDRMASPAP